MAQIGVGGGRKITKSTCFPFRKHTPNTPTDFFPLSAFGCRWEENTGMSSEVEREQRKQVWVVLCLSFTLSAGSQQMGSSVGGAESKRLKDPPSWDPPPSLVHYHTHPEEGSNSVLWAFRPWAVSLPQTLICEEKKMPTASVYRTVSKQSKINRNAEE